MTTPDQLRALFPEFESGTYPDSMVQQWLTVGAGFVNASRWGDQTDFGVILYACHWLTLSKRQRDAASMGLAPGQNSGLLTSKSVDGVSAGYDASSVTIEGANHFNLTVYGVQFKDLARMFGVGVLQVGAEDGRSGSMAWPGVIMPYY